MIGESGFEARADPIIVSGYSGVKLNSRAGTEGSTVSSLNPVLANGHRLETLSISRCLNHW